MRCRQGEPQIGTPVRTAWETEAALFFRGDEQHASLTTRCQQKLEGHSSVPLVLGIGRVFPTTKVAYNVFVEPKWSVADERAGCPLSQIFVGFNMQHKH
jgi:hypothetical protein